MKNRVPVSLSDRIFFGSMFLLILVAMIGFVWFDLTQMSKPGLWLAQVLALLPFLVGSALAFLGILEIIGSPFPNMSLPKLSLPKRKNKKAAQQDAPAVS